MASVREFDFDRLFVIFVMTKYEHSYLIFEYFENDFGSYRFCPSKLSVLLRFFC